MSASLKINIAYSGFLTVSLYLAQFITYPYVARVLGVENIGICNFVQNLVNWFMLFSMLGISILGVREISRCQDNEEQLHRTFSGLVQFNLACTVVTVAVYSSVVFLLPALSEYRPLLLLGAVQIIFNSLTWEWLFRGLEDFRFITLRSLAVRASYVAAVFIFVRTEEDYGLYFAILVGSIVANALINIPYALRHLRLRFIPWREVFARFAKSSATLGVYQLLNGMYLSFTVVYLGFVAGNEQVGLYTTATKLQNVILALYSAVTVVMMPRMSALLAQGRNTDAQELILKSVRLLFVFCIPVIMVSEFLAPEMIYLLAGEGYSGSIPMFRLAIPLILVIGLEQIFIVQVLMPMADDRAVLVNSLVGAIVGVSLNVLLVPALLGIGSVIVWGCSECAVLCSAAIFARRELEVLRYGKELARHALAFSPLVLILVCIYYSSGSICSYACAAIIAAIYCHVALGYILKDDSYRALCNNLARRFLVQ